MKPYLISLAFALALVVLIAFAAPIEPERQPVPVESQAPLTALVTIRAPDGPTEYVGHVNVWNTTFPNVELDISLAGDAVFRAGFDQ